MTDVQLMAHLISLHDKLATQWASSPSARLDSFDYDTVFGTETEEEISARMAEYHSDSFYTWGGS